MGNGRTIWIADAHCDDGKCFVVRADEKLTAFLELEAESRAGIVTPSRPFCELLACNGDTRARVEQSLSSKTLPIWQL